MRQPNGCSTLDPTSCAA